MPPHPTSCEVYRNIILPYKSGSSKWSRFRRFPHQDPVYTSSLPIRATCPAHLIPLDLITRAILSENYRSLNLLIMKLSPFLCAYKFNADKGSSWRTLLQHAAQSRVSGLRSYLAFGLRNDCHGYHYRVFVFLRKYRDHAVFNKPFRSLRDLRQSCW
jgi:hypothetical protein